MIFLERLTVPDVSMTAYVGFEMAGETMLIYPMV